MSESKQARVPAVDTVALAPVVDRLCRDATLRTAFPPGGKVTLPSREAVIEFVEDLRAVLFPGYFGTNDVHDESLHYFVGATLARALRTLEDQVRRGVAFNDRHDIETCDHCADTARRSDARVPREGPGDPAARRLRRRGGLRGRPRPEDPRRGDLRYPGMFAITNQRIAHELHVLGVPLIPRIITEHAHTLTGIDIHPGAAIGERFFIDHGTGVVIGETSRIGDRVRLYQGVTLGAKSFPLDENGTPIKGIDRHPIVEDDVMIYAGATILGRIVIGHGSSIGGNVWLTNGVPPGSRITQAEVREQRYSHGGGI